MRVSGPINLAYVRLSVRDLDTSSKFVGDLIGLQTVAQTAESRLFRSDDRYYSIALSAGGVTSVALEIAESADLDVILSRLMDHGTPVRQASPEECGERFVRRAIFTEDSAKFPIELVFGSARSGRRFYGTRDAGVRGLQSVGLCSVDVERDLAIWQAIGLKISDRVGGVAYLSCDAMHHRIALYPSRRSGLLYVSFEVESFDCVMQNYYHLQSHQVRILHGPGRETASGQAFVRFEGAEGQVFGFGCEMASLQPGHRPRQFVLDRYALCGWGSECQEIAELRADPGI